MTLLDKADVEAALASALEDLADQEHNRWAHWQEYMHGLCIQNDDGSLTIPAEYVRRWTEQINTAYTDLPDHSKDSDREQVMRYLPIVLQAILDYNPYSINGA